MMWKCSACQNENKDEYRFCLSCGNPKPVAGKVKAKSAELPRQKSPKAEPEKKSQSSAMTIVLLVLSLLLIVAIVAIIINFPRLSGRTSTDTAEEDRESSSQRHSSGRADADNSDWGGSSSFIFGGDTDQESSDAPAATFSPSSSETPAPATPLPIETPVPTPAPTATPVSEYLLPESNSRYLTEADLKNLTWEQCCLARNEIFARHGRMFQTTEIANYFNSKSWYRGTIAPANFSESVLNEYERANVNFISQYESAHWGGSYY